MLRRMPVLAAIVAAGAALAAQGPLTAAACGGLVAPNGAVRLSRATTLVAWHGGVEHYVTSFAYQGDVADVGWIVPLPAVPESVTRAGSWTLQRLEREIEPPLEDRVAFEAAPAAHAGVEILQTTTVDALDITVLRGSGQAVVDWCAQNHFLLNAETRAHLLAYAATSPIFMAAKFDTGQARLRGQFAGDGTPVLITMRTPRLWVPLEVLANADDPLDADLFLMTDGPVTLGNGSHLSDGAELPAAPGFRVVRQEPVTGQLSADLSSDRNMAWVPDGAWLTALTLRSSGEQVTYDLDVLPGGTAFLAAMGSGPGVSPAVAAVTRGAVAGLPGGSEPARAALTWAVAILAIAALAAVSVLGAVRWDTRAR